MPSAVVLPSPIPINTASYSASSGSQVENVLHLGERDVGLELVFRDPEGIEPAGLSFCLEHGDGVAVAAQVAGAREPGWSGANNRYSLSGAWPRLEQSEFVVENVVRRVALQQRDLDRLLIAIVEHAGTLAQDLDGTGARARVPERVRIEDHACRTAQVAGGDLLDERGHVDVRGAGDGAGRVVAVQALVCLEQRGVIGQRRRDVGEVGG